MAKDFIADTAMRIRARNLRAEPVIAELSGLRRFAAKSSLSLANMVDRFGGWMSDGAAAAFSGGLFGTVRGAIAGGAAYMGLAAFGASIAPLVGLALLGGYILYDAAHSYNVMKADDPRYHSAKRADWIASRGGALGQVRTPSPNQVHENRHAFRQVVARNDEAVHLTRSMDLEPQPEGSLPGGIVPGGFAEKELQRRQRSQAHDGPQGRVL